MIIDNCSTWSVQVTFPAGSLDAKGAARRWAHNDTITVVAESIARALELVGKQWPNARVWAMNHSGSRTILMVDDAAIPLAPPTLTMPLAPNVTAGCAAPMPVAQVWVGETKLNPDAFRASGVDAGGTFTIGGAVLPNSVESAPKGDG